MSELPLEPFDFDADSLRFVGILGQRIDVLCSDV